MYPPLFAILELEREPLIWADFANYLKSWFEGAGGFAAIGLVFYLLFALDSKRGIGRGKVLPSVLICGVLACFAYAAAAIFWMQEPAAPAVTLGPNGIPLRPAAVVAPQRELCLVAGGAMTLLGIMLPFLFDLLQCRPGRIWAIAKLSFKEAIRRKVLWVFLAFLLLFLFPTKWFVDVKREDEIRQTVAMVDLAMTVIMMLSFGLLAAFSIPTDLRNQTIHTVVTKPVQRFEIVLGRFLGYVSLMTIVLLVLRTVSLIMLYASNPSPEAAFESFRARIPAYGNLNLYNRRGWMPGESVGREWEYRKYIPGDPRSSHRALYQFLELPASLANDEAIPIEFSFDIFRTHRGEEGKGVQISLFFQTPDWNNVMFREYDEERLKDYQAEVRRLQLNPNRNPPPGDPDWIKWNELADKFGYFEFRGKEIADYHTFRIYIPGGLAKRALATGKKGDFAPLECRIKLESRSQFLGVAKRDFYIVAGEMPFWFNFYKGAFGLWLLVTLVIGISVSLSTFFSGVVSWLMATGLVTLGYFRDFVQEIAEGRAVGGGPLEAFIRLKDNANLITPLDAAPGAAAAQKLDIGLQWMYGRLLNAIPDVDRFDWSAYVAEGFNVPGSEMILSFLYLVAYLLPWLILGYYLMKSREVAN